MSRIPFMTSSLLHLCQWKGSLGGNQMVTNFNDNNFCEIVRTKFNAQSTGWWQKTFCNLIVWQCKSQEVNVVTNGVCPVQWTSATRPFCLVRMPQIWSLCCWLAQMLLVLWVWSCWLVQWMVDTSMQLLSPAEKLVTCCSEKTLEFVVSPACHLWIMQNDFSTQGVSHSHLFPKWNKDVTSTFTDVLVNVPLLMFSWWFFPIRQSVFMPKSQFLHQFFQIPKAIKWLLSNGNC